MATPKKPLSLGKLIGETLQYSDDTGEVILVPANQEGSKQSLMIVAAQVRSLLQDAVKGYKERGVVMTPTELKQLAEAAKALATFQGEVYGGTAPGNGSSPKKPVPRGMEEAVEVEEVSFDNIKKPE